MKRLVTFSCLAFALLTLPPAAAVAGVPLAATGVLHQYCAADQDVTTHQNLIVMRQVVTTDELATFGGTIFAGIYDRVTSSDEAGIMAVRIRVERADGGRERLGKMVARQDEQGNARAEERFPIAIRKRDTVIWRFRLRNFADLNAGECFVLTSVTGKP